MPNPRMDQGGGYTNYSGTDGNPLGDEDTVRRVNVINRYIGGGQLTPSDALAMAKDPNFSDEQLIRTVGPAIGFAHAVKRARQFTEMTRVDAVSGHGTKMQKQWEDMDPIQQSL